MSIFPVTIADKSRSQFMKMEALKKEKKRTCCPTTNPPFQAHYAVSFILTCQNNTKYHLKNVTLKANPSPFSMP